MDLVEHHEAKVLERGRARVQHVAQDLGGHHDDGGVAVDGVVPGEQADRVGVVAPDQVVVLLVGERLDRRRVEALLVLRQREVDGVLADDGLARPGGGRDEDTVPVRQRGAGGNLERVEVEVVELTEAGELRGGLPFPELRVPFGRAHRWCAHATKTRGLLSPVVRVRRADLRVRIPVGRPPGRYWLSTSTGSWGSSGASSSSARSAYGSGGLRAEGFSLG